MPNYNGQLLPNEIFGAMFNMIISQDIYGARLSGLDSALVTKFRTDGTLYGDTKLFYSADILETHPWGNDAEAQNLLALDRPNAPQVQAIVIDQFRQIRLTVDNYLSKRAWSTEGAFSSFNSVMLSYIGKTKKLYDTLLIDTYVGTVQSPNYDIILNFPSVGDVEDPSTLSNVEIESIARRRAQAIGKGIADAFVELSSPSRRFNDYEFMDAYNPEDFVIVWSSAFANEIEYIDLPTIFHKNGIMSNIESTVLPYKYFGYVNNVNKTDAYTGTHMRTLVEGDWATAVNQPCKHLFPGDQIPKNSKVVLEKNADGTAKTLANYAWKAKEAYVANGGAAGRGDIICKIIHKDAIKYMSAFETSTEFFNPRSLTENHYLTFGYSKPDYLKHLPVIMVMYSEENY